MQVTPLSIPDVLLIEPRVFGDARGFFLETWSDAGFSAGGIDASFVQDNLSRSTLGVLRGLHFQRRHTQGKLVRCTRGEVFDVAVDLRQGSSSFGQWIGELLSEDNKRALWIPPGFAHGFLSLSATVDFQYKCSDIYDPESECTINWDDPDIGISWPLERVGEVQLSVKDRERGMSLADTPPLAGW